MLYYGLPEEVAGFEHAIESDPYELTNHLALADWFQDQNDLEEADFRRAMAEWLQRGPKSFPQMQDVYPQWDRPWNFGVLDLPSWVHPQHIPLLTGDRFGWDDGEPVDMRANDDPIPPHFARYHPNYMGVHGWRTFRDLTDAFRIMWHRDRARKAPRTTRQWGRDDDPSSPINSSRYALYAEEEIPQDEFGNPIPDPSVPQLDPAYTDQPGDQPPPPPPPVDWHPNTPDFIKYLPPSGVQDYLDVWQERWNEGYPGIPDWVSHMLGHTDQTVQPQMAPPVSKARIDWVSPIQQQRTAETWRQMRIGLSPDHAGDMVGAPDDATVRVQTDNDGSIGISLESPVVEGYRSLFRGRDGMLVLDNMGLEIHPDHRGSGLGLEIFVQQVITASAAGVNRIVCMAAGQGNQGYPSREPDVYNGYYTWPLFGYDAPIDSLQNPEASQKIRRAYPHAKTVLDIFLTPGGRQWWKTHGVKIPRAVFDLTPGSRSLMVLQAYAEEKAAQRSRTPAPSSSQPPTPPGTSSPRSSAKFSRLPADYARHAVRAPAGGVAWKNKLFRGGKFVPAEYAQAQSSDGEPLNYGPEDELAGFHQVIRENPLEGTHHAVLADWLDEMGDPQEADFRRHIASWLQVAPPTFREGHPRPWFLPGTWDQVIWPQGLRGVVSRMGVGSTDGWGIDGGRVDMPPDDSGALFDYDEIMTGLYGTSWRDYDEMIDSLRESYLHRLSNGGVS